MIEPEFDMWEHLKVPCGGYNSAIDEDLIRVMKHVQRSDQFDHDIVNELDLPEHYIELLKYILCTASSLWEYGSSPTYCYPCDKDKTATFISKCENYFEYKWGKKWGKK